MLLLQPYECTQEGLPSDIMLRALVRAAVSFCLQTFTCVGIQPPDKRLCPAG